MSLGMIGQKAGMTRVFDNSGISIPVTAISVEPNVITQIKTLDKDGYKAVQLSFGSKRENRVSKAIIGHYKKSSLKPGKGLVEFRINDSEIDALEIGKQITLELFKEGEHVDITGTTIGKGFQGGVKRHHFKTQDATHGNSLSHRALGSTGQCQDPGRVFKGKKMPGQLGNVKNTIQNLVIVKIIEEDNLILVKGSIPGHDGSNVIIRHTKKKYTPKKILTETNESKEIETKNNNGEENKAKAQDKKVSEAPIEDIKKDKAENNPEASEEKKTQE